MSDPRIDFWIAYFKALLDAVGPNRADLSLVQRALFILLPASGVLPVVAYKRAHAESLIEPFQSVFASWHWVALIILVWWGATAWVFRDRIRSHGWSGDLSARRKLLAPLLLVLIAVVALVYFTLATSST